MQACSSHSRSRHRRLSLRSRQCHFSLFAAPLGGRRSARRTRCKRSGRAHSTYSARHAAGSRSEVPVSLQRHRAPARGQTSCMRGGLPRPRPRQGRCRLAVTSPTRSTGPSLSRSRTLPPLYHPHRRGSLLLRSLKRCERLSVCMTQSDGMCCVAVERSGNDQRAAKLTGRSDHVPYRNWCGRATCNMQLVRRATCNMQHAAGAARNMQHAAGAARNMQYATCNRCGRAVMGGLRRVRVWSMQRDDDVSS
jgi:hypothetical protein